MDNPVMSPLEKYKHKLNEGAEALAREAAGTAYSKNFRIVVLNVILQLRQEIKAFDGSPTQLKVIEKMWHGAHALARSDA